RKPATATAMASPPTPQLTVNPTAQLPPQSVPPTELLPQAASPYSPDPAYVGPTVAAPVAVKSSSKILLIIPILLLILGGAGFGAYYYIRHHTNVLGPAENSKEFDEDLAKAKELHKAGNYTEAAKIYARLLE